MDLVPGGGHPVVVGRVLAHGRNPQTVGNGVLADCVWGEKCCGHVGSTFLWWCIFPARRTFLLTFCRMLADARYRVTKPSNQVVNTWVPAVASAAPWLAASRRRVVGWMEWRASSLALEMIHRSMVVGSTSRWNWSARMLGPWANAWLG